MVSSEFLYAKAKLSFRTVLVLHDMPCSIRVMVLIDILAFLASSALLIIRDSLTFLKEFLLISSALGPVWPCLVY